MATSRSVSSFALLAMTCPTTSWSHSAMRSHRRMPRRGCGGRVRLFADVFSPGQTHDSVVEVGDAAFALEDSDPLECSLLGT
jgi:hypothetical protein